MRKIIVTLFIIVLICPIANSQLNFFFQPEVYGRNIDGLSTVKLQNLTNQTLSGQLLIAVKEISTQQSVVNIIMPVADFPPGMNSLPAGLFRNSRLNFSNNAWAGIVNQTRNFPPGNYSFCFQFSPSKNAADNYEDCFEFNVQPLLPISLISPADKDTICLKRPYLTWQPPMPYSSFTRFRMLLVEKTSVPTESILKNPPIALLDNIPASGVNYPSSYPELKEGHTYVWQVVAYQQGLIISTSEVWEFTVQCKETEKPVPFDSYRELKSMVNGNYYIANRLLRFSFLNQYNQKKLSYTIHDLEKGGAVIEHSPEVTLQQGHNKIGIDLTELNLIAGKQYLLKVYPFNEPMIEIRFIYQDKEDAL